MANILEIAQNNLGQEGRDYFCGNVSNTLNIYNRMPPLYTHSWDFMAFYKHLEYFKNFSNWMKSNKNDVMPLIISYMSCGDFDALSIYCGFITDEDFDNTLFQIYPSFLEEGNTTGLAKETAKSWLEYRGIEFETSFCNELGNLDSCAGHYEL